MVKTGLTFKMTVQTPEYWGILESGIHTVLVIERAFFKRLWQRNELPRCKQQGIKNLINLGRFVILWAIQNG
jgi:hypothetical protein